MDWQLIDTAPKDGTVIMLKRVYQGRSIADGPGLFGALGADAPARQAMGADPLGRLSRTDYAREDADREAWATKAMWLREDRQHAFPAPTHWAPKTGETT